jgi:hypothetical protein
MIPLPHLQIETWGHLHLAMDGMQTLVGRQVWVVEDPGMALLAGTWMMYFVSK